MADSWDSDAALAAADSFAVAAGKTDKWEGEDEDDLVKDSWEDDDAEEKTATSEGGEGKAFQRKKKKPLAERIAEKEAARTKAEEDEKNANKELTREEKLAEKLKVQRIQEASDLKLAEEAFGVSASASASEGSLDSMHPVSEEEFFNFAESLKEKITEFEKSSHYPGFLEKLFTDLVLGVETESLKKLGSLLGNLFHERQKLQKEESKKKKKKTKVNLKVDSDYADIAGAAGGYFENYDEDDI